MADQNADLAAQLARFAPAERDRWLGEAVRLAGIVERYRAIDEKVNSYFHVVRGTGLLG
jgi:hypothetical protein